ncbi:MAG: PAS domain S-box protein [Cyclobacteriaceae bacterium]|nr:PAS domain S-box protein [Cyclobacteriaceae bacterium]
MGFYKLIESQIDPVFLIDDSGKICFTNTAFDNCFGMKAGGCAGKNISDTIPFQHPERFFAALKSIGPELPEVAFSDNLQVSVLQTELIHISLFDESTSGKDRIISGKVVLLPVAIEPTNELCCATNSLYSVEQKYKTIFNLTFEGVIIHVAGIIIEINPAFERMMGYRQDELIGVNIIDLCVLPQYRDQVISALKNVATPPYEVLAKRKDGTILHTEIESRQIILNNQVLRVTAIRDITERKLAENRLKESQERYKLLSNLTFEGIFIHDNGVLIDVNESFADLIGYERKELIGQNIIHKVILPDYQPIVYEAIKNQKISPYEVKAKRLDGSVFYAEVESRLINPKNSTLRVTAARDITSRKEAERKLQENEEELDMFFPDRQMPFSL